MAQTKSLIEISAPWLATMLGNPFMDREHNELLDEKLEADFQEENRAELREEGLID